MYIDDFLVMTDVAGQAITDASAASTDYVDSLAESKALVAPGARLKVSVNTAFSAATGAPTLTVGLQSDTDSGFASNLVTHVTTTAALAAALTAGTVLLDIQLPVNVQRYIRLYFTLGGTGTFDAGKVDGMIVLDTNRTMDRSL